MKHRTYVKMFAALALLAGCLTTAHAAHSGGNELFWEDFGSGPLDAGVWRAWGHNPPNFHAETIDMGGGDHALVMGNMALDWSVGAETVASFNRANNLSVTFTHWGVDDTAALGLDFTHQYPGAAGIHGPLHGSDNSATIYADIECGIDFWWNQPQHSENNNVQNGEWVSPELIAALNRGDGGDMVSKAGGIRIEVTLGNDMGCMLRWTKNGGVTWTTEWDSRGQPTYPNRADPGTPHTTGSAAQVYIGFGPAQGGIVFDDIYVQDDFNRIPVEISEFTVE